MMTLLVCTALPQLAQARKVQGFESGDPAVTSIGDAGPKGTYNSVAPTEGSTQFLLTTVGMNAAMEDGLGSQAGGFAVTNLNLSNFFNGAVPAGGSEGSGVLIPFTVGVGENLLTFDADFLSNEIFQDPAVKRNDFAFYSIFNSLSAALTGPTTFASVNGSAALFKLAGGSNPFQFHTDYQTYSVSLAGLAPGNYALGIGVEDAGGTAHASGVLLDNVLVVPEPSTFALGIAGAGLLVGLHRRIKRA